MVKESGFRKVIIYKTYIALSVGISMKVIHRYFIKK